MGIDKNTPNPAEGRIERDPVTGEARGSLKEAAAGLMPEQELTADQQAEAMKLFQERMHGWGYTVIQNMSGRSNLKAFADGVIEGVTGYLLEPYEEAAGKGSDYYGEFL